MNGGIHLPSRCKPSLTAPFARLRTNGERRAENSRSPTARSNTASSMERSKLTDTSDRFRTARTTLGTVIQFSDFHTPAASPTRGPGTYGAPHPFQRHCEIPDVLHHVDGIGKVESAFQIELLHGNRQHFGRDPSLLCIGQYELLQLGEGGKTLAHRLERDHPESLLCKLATHQHQSRPHL